MTPLRAFAWLTAVSLVAACTPPPPPSAQSRADQATVAACRTRADEVFARQNRGSQYTQDNRDSPESGAYNSGITSSGLADRYGWGTDLSNCLRQGSTGQPEANPGPTMTPVSR